MRAIVSSFALVLGLVSSAYAQNQTLKGVYAPPGSAAPGFSSTGSGLGSTANGLPTSLNPSATPGLPSTDLGAVGNGPRVILPGGKPVQGQTLPGDVTSTPIPDRPGYGSVTVNGHRTIVDTRNNRVFQVLD